MNLASALYLGGGLVLLLIGAEGLVRGASRLAAAAGISPLVIGLTIVAFGTSSPEVAVSVTSAVNGEGDISLGNVLGSNIFNVLFILGVSALIVPLVVAQRLVRVDVPVMIGVSAVVLLMGLDNRIGRIDGAVLLLGLVAYTGYQVWEARREAPSAEFAQEFGAPAKPKGSSLPGNLALIVIGLGVMVLGSRWLVSAAVDVAEALGVSELIIGLTIVAAGTSLPEVATSILAAMRGERDIAVGNVVGSNIFNILGVLGISSVVATGGGLPVPDAALRFDLPVMLAVALASLPVLFSGLVISRWEGLLFLGYYVAYALYLILNATGHRALPAFNGVMLGFVIPLTAITLLLILWRTIRDARRARSLGEATK